MRVWKDYTTEEAIIITEQAMKAIKAKTINSCWRKPWHMLCMTSQDDGKASQGDHEGD